jgi:hypothetical protein
MFLGSFLFLSLFFIVLIILARIKQSSSFKIKGFLLSLELILFLPILVFIFFSFVKIIKTQKQQAGINVKMLKQMIILSRKSGEQFQNMKEWLDLKEDGISREGKKITFTLKNGQIIEINEDDYDD